MTEEAARAREAEAEAEAAAAAAEEAEEEEEEDEADEFVMPAIPDRSRYPDQGVLPRVIRNLVLKRREVKKQMASERDAGRREQLDVRQKAIKILANSMYGCLGFSGSRFYAKALAALVTSQGREILQNTVSLATNKLGLEVRPRRPGPPALARRRSQARTSLWPPSCRPAPCACFPAAFPPPPPPPPPLPPSLPFPPHRSSTATQTRS